MNFEIFSRLTQAAQQARKKAWVPVSHFSVGAAALSATGNIYSGPNIEESTIKSNTHGEESVIGAMIRAEGYNKITHLVAIGEREGCEHGDTVCTPCGHCRQMLAEFADGNLQIAAASPQGSLLMSTTLAELLPGRFFAENFQPGSEVNLGLQKGLADEIRLDKIYLPDLFYPTFMELQKSYTPVSGRASSASIMLKDGSIFTGASIEESAFKGTQHAIERALAKFVGTQDDELSSVILVADGGGCSANNQPSPCGHCLQTLAEFADNRLKIIVADIEGNLLLKAELGQLLPHAFRLWDFKPKNIDEQQGLKL